MKSIKNQRVENVVNNFWDGRDRDPYFLLQDRVYGRPFRAQLEGGGGLINGLLPLLSNGALSGLG